jgi:antitoxin VapB
MPLNIEDSETEDLARELAARTGESITLAIKRALKMCLLHVRPARESQVLLEELANIRKLWASLPVLDTRTADEILGYDDNGLPH